MSRVSLRTGGKTVATGLGLEPSVPLSLMNDSSNLYANVFGVAGEKDVSAAVPFCVFLREGQEAVAQVLNQLARATR